MDGFTHACVRYVDDRLKDYVARTADIFFDKKVKKPIEPTSEFDFNDKHEYRIFCHSCKEKNCNLREKCCNTFKKGYIVSIGRKYFIIGF